MWRRKPRLRWKVPFDHQRREVAEDLRGKGWSLWLRTVVMFGALPLALVIFVTWRHRTVGPDLILWTLVLVLLGETRISSNGQALLGAGPVGQVPGGAFFRGRSPPTNELTPW